MKEKIDPLCGKEADDARDAEREAQEWDAMEWETCGECGGDGVVGHYCGEDCCACLHPEENQRCATCDGEGGWRNPT